MSIPLLHLGGSLGPVVHWAPAAGFPLETYADTIDRLAERFRVLAMPPRALWPAAGPPPDAPGSWESVAEDLVAGLVEHELHDVVLVGHSFGGVASLLAAREARSRVRALALLDPTILPPARMDELRVGKASGWRTLPHPLAGRTRERRARFASRDEAFAHFRGRALFAEWPDAALWRYVHGALAADNGGFALRWSPAWEAYYYESIYPEVWRDVASMDPSLPFLVARGETTDTFVAEAAARVQELAPWAHMVTIPGHGHLFPLSAPEATAEAITTWLARVAPGQAGVR